MVRHHLLATSRRCSPTLVCPVGRRPRFLRPMGPLASGSLALGGAVDVIAGAPKNPVSRKVADGQSPVPRIEKSADPPHGGLRIAVGDEPRVASGRADASSPRGTGSRPARGAHRRGLTLPSAIAARAIGPSPGPASPSPRLARPARVSMVDVCWIALAQVFLEIGEPSGEVPPQPAFGKEPEAGRRVLANPLRIHELAHIPASTERDEASDERPAQEGQSIPQRVPQVLPSQPVQIPVSHVAHLQLGGRAGDHHRRCPWRGRPAYAEIHRRKRVVRLRPSQRDRCAHLRLSRTDSVRSVRSRDSQAGRTQTRGATFDPAASPGLVRSESRSGTPSSCTAPVRQRGRLRRARLTTSPRRSQQGVSPPRRHPSAAARFHRL